MTEKINCPFCGEMIDINSIKCSNCDALFKEPELPNIKFNELGPFTAIDILTLGFFSTIWFFINGKNINKLTNNDRDGIKLNWLFILLAVNGIFYLFCFYKNPTILAIVALIQYVIYIALSYRVLRIIQKHTLSVYNSEIDYNPHYMVMFNIFYLIHFIETYQKRVYHTHAFFDWKSPQGITLIILLAILLCAFRFYKELFMLIS